jgi:hypothetical protein
LLLQRGVRLPGQQVRSLLVHLLLEPGETKNQNGVTCKHLLDGASVKKKIFLTKCMKPLEYKP